MYSPAPPLFSSTPVARVGKEKRRRFLLVTTAAVAKKSCVDFIFETAYSLPFRFPPFQGIVASSWRPVRTAHKSEYLYSTRQKHISSLSHPSVTMASSAHKQANKIVGGKKPSKHALDGAISPRSNEARPKPVKKANHQKTRRDDFFIEGIEGSADSIDRAPAKPLHQQIASN